MTNSKVTDVILNNIYNNISFLKREFKMRYLYFNRYPVKKKASAIKTSLDNRKF